MSVEQKIASASLTDLFQYVRSRKEKTGERLDPGLSSVSEPSSDRLL